MIQKKDFNDPNPRPESQKPHYDNYRQRINNDDKSHFGHRGRRNSEEKLSNDHDDNQSFREKHSKQQIVYGLRPIIEAIDAGKQIDRVLIQSNLDGNLIIELKEKLKEKNIPFQYVPAEKLNKVTTANHQGVVATIAPVEYKSLMDLLPTLFEQGRVPFILMLDHLTDVRNMGAIVRTAECVDADAIVVPDHGSAQLNEDAIKTSSGALLRMPICRETNLKTAINLAKQSGLQVIAASEKGATNYLDIDFRQPTLLIMGSEDMGINPELLKLCDLRAKLPIMGNVQSLNVSAAAAVFMYELLRQRGMKS